MKIAGNLYCLSRDASIELLVGSLETEIHERLKIQNLSLSSDFNSLLYLLDLNLI